MENKGRNRGEGKIDYMVLILTVTITVIGIIMVYSASYVNSGFRYENPNKIIYKEIIFAIIGMALMFLGMKIPYRIYRGTLTRLLAWITFITFLLLLTPMGLDLNGGLRWINLGFTTFMPSELAKYTCIFLMSEALTKKDIDCRRLGDAGKFWLAPGFFIAMVAMQPDLSTAFILFCITFYLYYIGGIRKTWIFFLFGIGILGIAGLIAIEPFRILRVKTLLDPFYDPQGAGYQVLQSLYAIASGGIKGVGLGASRQKLLYLPEPQNDYIFAIISEELGFIGSLSIIFLFVALISRCFMIAANAPDRYATFIVSGITIQMALQSLVNMFVAVSLLPSTGIPLPLISYGGTSLVLNLFAMGIILNISKYDRRYIQKDKDKVIKKKYHKIESRRRNI
ncbi:FtsW/RodA/SpoVE family cell cycle protein [Proteocatella sphenisci]|uniref:FtsW/RodA/SpoVE family cell cycle protein n=1 Tax=Proteocatella sphenisci TaxID=181070 RepID=UPI0004B98EB4|nr:putative peptidoglycan glycosyltransferase FtsW [Proteocatella sphenisci]